MTRVELSPEDVTRRLRAASRLSPLGERQAVPAKVGNSPRLISSRLRKVSLLRDLCLRLGRYRSAVPAAPGTPK